MGVIPNRYGLAEVSVWALEAAANVLLIPLDSEATINTIYYVCLLYTSDAADDL